MIRDIDGCLSPESHSSIDGQRLSQIAEYNILALRNNGRPLVTLCSGRPIGFVEAMCRLIHNTRIPCIGENGVCMWMPDDNSFEIRQRTDFVSECEEIDGVLDILQQLSE